MKKEDWVVITVYGTGILAVGALVVRGIFHKKPLLCSCGGKLKETDRVRLPSGSLRTLKCTSCGVVSSRTNV